VTGEKDRHAGFVQRDHELPQVANPARIQAVARLVQDQQPRAADQGGGQAEALAHAQGVRLDRPAAHPGQSHQLQGLIDPPAPAGPAREPARPGRVQ